MGDAARASSAQTWGVGRGMGWGRSPWGGRPGRNADQVAENESGMGLKAVASFSSSSSHRPPASPVAS